MPKNRSTAAQHARQAQKAVGGKYTALLRANGSPDGDQGLLSPEPNDPQAPSWCPRCRYSFLLHRAGQCPEPAVYRFCEMDVDGPHWGGGLHSHGQYVWVYARADAGRGPWLTPDMALGGPEALKDALMSTSYLENGPDGPEAVYGGVDQANLQTVLDHAFPGATEGPFALDRYADVDTEPSNLAEGEFMWDCECDGGDY